MRLIEFVKVTEKKRDYALGAGVLIYAPLSDRFLLQKRGPRVEDAGQWDYFGGGVDPGENVFQGAVRELEEEGGITVSTDDLFPMAIFGKDMSKKLGGYHIFVVIVEDEIQPNLNYDADAHDEVAGAKWLGQDELSKAPIHKRVSTLLRHQRFPQALSKAVRTKLSTPEVQEALERLSGRLRLL
jgi:8-oxo-dGTP pyrophosphatase MutT (NUDIX family)